MRGLDVDNCFLVLLAPTPSRRGRDITRPHHVRPLICRAVDKPHPHLHHARTLHSIGPGHGLQLSAHVLRRTWCAITVTERSCFATC